MNVRRNETLAQHSNNNNNWYKKIISASNFCLYLKLIFLVDEISSKLLYSFIQVTHVCAEPYAIQSIYTHTYNSKSEWKKKSKKHTSHTHTHNVEQTKKQTAKALKR